MQKWKNVLRVALLIMSIVILGGCTTKRIHPAHGTVGDQIQSDMIQAIDSNKTPPKKVVRVPSSVSNALLPSVADNWSTTTESPLKRFDVSADKIQAKAFF